MDTPGEDTIKVLQYDSLEYLICYLRFIKKAPDVLLLNLLKRYPSDIDAFMAAIRSNNFDTVSNLLAEGPPRPLLPTADWYDLIIDAFLKEPDPILAENLFRYLLFFDMKGAHETAIPYLIKQYQLLNTEEEKKVMMNPYCWNANYIPVGRDADKLR